MGGTECIPSEKALKSKELNVGELIENLITNPKNPGFVDLRVFDYKSIIEDYPTQTQQ